MIVDVPSWEHFGTHGQSAYPELWEGVRAYYAPCLGPTGTRLAELSGLSNWGTLTNMDAATDWVVDGGRYSLDFDGSNDYVLISDNNSLDIESNGNLTISVWVRRSVNVGTYETVVTKRPSAGAFTNYELSFNNTSTGSSKAFGFYSGSSFTISSTLVGLSSWTHIATVTNASGTTYYVNGRSAGTSATTVGSPNEHPLKIGAVAGSPETQYFNGQIDDVILFNRPVTAAEIRLLYQIGRGGMLTPAPSPALFAFPNNPLAIFAASHAAVIGG